MIIIIIIIIIIISFIMLIIVRFVIIVLLLLLLNYLHLLVCLASAHISYSLLVQFMCLYLFISYYVMIIS